MKRITKFIVTLAAATCFALPFASCGTGKTLDSPTGFNLDDNYNLTWTPVVNARSYIIDIKNVNTGAKEEATSRRENIALSYLETGDYDIRIQAVGDGSRFNSSDWSAVISFNRAYESGCAYRLINEGTEYEVFSASVTVKEIVLEDSYRGKPVTSVGNGAFRNARELQSVTLGKNVRRIDASAFSNCFALERISIPDSLSYLGTGVFYSCGSLESFKMPSGITALPNATFAYCKSLKEIDLNNVTTIGDSAFMGCAALTEFTFPDDVVSIESNAFANAANLKEVTFGSGLGSIGDKAFSMCTSLDTVNFSEEGNLKTLGAQAFQFAAFTSIDLPDGLTKVGQQAFYGVSALQEITIPDSVSVVGHGVIYNTGIHKAAVDNGDRLYYADKWLAGDISKKDENPIKQLYDEPDGFEETEVLREDTVGIADMAFLGKDIEDVRLTKNVRFVGAAAFNLCDKLYRFDASNSALELVDVGAFAYCTVLEAVEFNHTDPKLTEISSQAFIGCEELNYNKGEFSSRFIPVTVEHIGAYAFKDTKLYKNADEYGVIYADDWVVGCQGTYEVEGGEYKKPKEGTVASRIELDKNVRGIADYAFYACLSLESITNTTGNSAEGRTGVEIIGIGAFYNCARLTGFTFSSNVRKIESFTFYNCMSLIMNEDVNRLPTNLRSIGRSAFYNCQQIQAVDLSRCRQLDRVGYFAFYGCQNLTSITFNSRLSQISAYAFYGCERLPTVTIPENIKTIGMSAFSRCYSLEEIVFEEGVEEIGPFAFRSAEALEEINLPDSVKTVGYAAFLQCENVQSIDLGRVETIGDFAFAENYGVRSLVVPDSVKTIGKGAFYYLGAEATDDDGNPLGGVQSVIVSGSPENVEAHAFYGCNVATFYMDDANRGDEWGFGWNSSRRPVIWGVTLSEDNSYVVSFTVGEDTFDYYDTLNGLGSPYREGYEFVGWSLSENGTEVAYTAKDVMTAPVGTTLYAVYKQLA